MAAHQARQPIHFLAAFASRQHASLWRIVLVAEARVLPVRVFNREQGHNRDWRHWPWCRESPVQAVPFAELSFQRLRSVLRQRDGGDREMADILALVLHHDEKLVEQAVCEAIASGVIKTHILNRLSRLLDTPPPAALEPPPSLSRIANTERYDSLKVIIMSVDTLVTTLR